MARNIIGLIVAYLVFAVSAVVLFWLSGHAPHQAQPVGFEILTALYGLFFSLLAGAVQQFIARTGNLVINYALAAMIVVFAAASLITSTGSHWTQWLAILLFAPASIAGGWLYLRRFNP